MNITQLSDTLITHGNNMEKAQLGSMERQGNKYNLEYMHDIVYFIRKYMKILMLVLYLDDNTKSDFSPFLFSKFIL